LSNDVVQNVVKKKILIELLKIVMYAKIVAIREKEKITIVK